MTTPNEHLAAQKEFTISYWTFTVRLQNGD
jgi:hypothetical protein